MPALCRKDDTNNAGGAVVSIPQSSVIANGKVACVLGSSIAPHAPCSDVPVHCNAVVVESDSTVLIEGIPTTHVNNGNSCGHSMATGSPDIIIGTG